MAEYAVIRVGNKQHRVRDGETLVVERVATDEGKTFTPEVLLGGSKVTATVVGHERGPKIRIGKYKKRTGYKRHNGYRSALTRIQISLGTAAKAAPAKKEAAPKAEPAAAAPAAAPKGMPAGYADMTVTQIAEGAKTWRRPQLDAALAYEQQNANRKGAISALEAAIAAKEDQ
ncbi:MAG: bL21 family ribosomal protein [Actinobacteria bacterium]|nr:bL21 family ribosomal protein [Actinomycetota bacterium]